MKQLDLAKLIVAGICHEIANHLNVVQLLCEDICDAPSDITELQHNVQLLSLTLRFFRNIYTISGHTESLVNIVNDMAIAKHISITNRENLPQKSSVNPNVEKLLCGALYLVTKCCKPNDELIVSSVDKTITEIAVKNKDRTLPNWAINALQQDVPENSINIFAIYIKTLAISIGYSIYVNSTNTDGLKMRIYGNDN